MPIDATILQRLSDNDAKLTELGLIDKNLTDADILQLYEALKTNSTLQSLSLGGSQTFSDNCMKEEDIKRNTRINKIIALTLPTAALVQKLEEKLSILLNEKLERLTL